MFCNKDTLGKGFIPFLLVNPSSFSYVRENLQIAFRQKMETNEILRPVFAIP